MRHATRRWYELVGIHNPHIHTSTVPQMLRPHASLLPALRRQGTAAATVFAAAAGLSGLLLVDRRDVHVSAAAQTEQQEQAVTTNKQKLSAKQRGKIEVDLMDRIASKPYVNYHNTHAPGSGVGRGVVADPTGPIRRSTRAVASRFRRRERSGDPDLFDDDVKMTDYEEYDAAGRWDGSDDGGGVGGAGGKRGERPRGVPRRVRILAIDVPELREVFDGECKVNLSRVFPDDVAPRKKVKRRGTVKPGGNKNKKKKKKQGKSTADNDSDDDDQLEEPQLQVMQKSLATALVRCRNRESKRIGVEILEASVFDLNPHNMRKTYQFGKFKYDPGKYSTKKPGHQVTRSAEETPADDIEDDDDVDNFDDEVDESGPADDFEDETRNVQQSSERGRRDRGSRKDQEETMVATDEDELDAPWNQYAWIEEMQIRTSGLVPFGAPAQRSSMWSQYIFGDVYRRSVPPARGLISRWLPSFLTGDKFGDDGIDGDYGRGRSGDRLTPNRASAKPHAVVADGAAMQRVPGSLRHLTRCCREADVPLFIVNDPRVWGGNTHSDLESAADDMRRAIKNRVVVNALNIKEGSMFERGRLLGQLETEAAWLRKDMARRTRQAVREAQSRLKKEREDDWSKLNEEDLLERLIERKVVNVERMKKSPSRGEHENVARESYSNGFLALCRRCLGYDGQLDTAKQTEDDSIGNSEAFISDLGARSSQDEGPSGTMSAT